RPFPIAPHAGAAMLDRGARHLIANLATLHPTHRVPVRRARTREARTARHRQPAHGAAIHNKAVILVDLIDLKSEHLAVTMRALLAEVADSLKRPADLAARASHICDHAAAEQQRQRHLPVSIGAIGDIGRAGGELAAGDAESLAPVPYRLTRRSDWE